MLWFETKRKVHMCELILKFVQDKGQDKEKTTNTSPNIEATPK